MQTTPCGRCGGPRQIERFRGADLVACPQCGAVTLNRADFERLLGATPMVGRPTLIPDDELQRLPSPSVPPPPPRLGTAPGASTPAPQAPASAPPMMITPEPAPSPYAQAPAAPAPYPAAPAPHAAAPAPSRAQPWSPPQRANNPTLLPDDEGPTAEAPRAAIDHDNEPGLGDLRLSAMREPVFDDMPRAPTDEVPTMWAPTPEETEEGIPEDFRNRPLPSDFDDDEPLPPRRGAGRSLLVIGAIGAFAVMALAAPVVGFLGARLLFADAEVSSAPPGPALADAMAAPSAPSAPSAPGAAPAPETLAATEAPPAPPEPAVTEAPAKPVEAPAEKPAAKPVEKPVEAKPAAKSAKSLSSKGWNLVGSDSAAAAELFQQALEIAPDDPDANYGYGYTLVRLGRASEAQSYLCRAKRLGGQDTVREVAGVLNSNGLSCD